MGLANATIEVAFSTLLANTTDMMFVKNADLVYVAASMPFAKMVGKNCASEIFISQILQSRQFTKQNVVVNSSRLLAVSH